MYALMSFICLVSGSMIYICFRPKSLLMFHWAQAAGISGYIYLIRDTAKPIGRAFPEWVIGSLPYAMWVLSYMLAQRSIWHHSRSLASCFWILTAPTIAILSEIAQSLKIVPGTFDWIDLLVLAMAAIIGAKVCFPQKPSTDDHSQVKANRISNVVHCFYRFGRRKHRHY